MPPANQQGTPSSTTDLYSSDQPIHSRDQDRFNRWPFADRISQTIARRTDFASLVVGIYGIWGDGKSSVLYLLEEALKSYEDIVQVRFNPWLFESQAQLCQGFFTTLADALGKSLPTMVQEIGRLLDRYGAILSVASINVGDGTVKIDPGSGLREFGKSLSTVELQKLKERLEAILRESRKRIVVLIDDIDRLDRHEVQAIFKLVKLSAGFERTNYVLAFDDEIVAAALGERYGEGGKEAGRNFLEKIVQVPLRLPPADQLSLRKLTFDGVQAALDDAGIQLSEEQVELFVNHFVNGLEHQLETPRQAKRYGNALAFALPILKDEVNPVDQMLIEGIHVFYPRLYKVIRDKSELFLCEHRDLARDEAFRKQVTETIDDAMQGLNPRERERIRKGLLEVLFPQLKGVFSNVSFGSDSLKRWYEGKRVCSPEYFDRYFRYSVPPGDVADLAVERLIEVSTSDGEKAERSFMDIAEHGGMKRLIMKLRYREETVDPLAAKCLAVLIARYGSFVPREKAMLMSDWSFSQAVILIKHLLLRVPTGGERDELARRLIHEAEPLAFAGECLRRFKKSKDELETDRLLSIPVEEELSRILAGRVRESAARETIYKSFPVDAPYLLWIWNKHGTEGEVALYLTGRFESHPAEVEEFLASYLGTSWGLEDGLSRKGDFGENAYNSIKEFFDPNLLFANLRNRYGEEIDNPDYYHSGEGVLGRRIAHQFAVIHKRAEEVARKPAEEKGTTE